MHRTLSEFSFPPDVYALGRLDYNSEGLLLLSDEAGLNARLLDPSAKHSRVYWVQVENIPTEDSLIKLSDGISIRGRTSLPCRVRLLASEPPVGPRDPPIRVRKSIPTTWLEMELIEGKNHQVRRMTAAIGCPTLRLIRVRVGLFSLGALPAGCWKILDARERSLLFTNRSEET